MRWLSLFCLFYTALFSQAIPDAKSAKGETELTRERMPDYLRKPLKIGVTLIVNSIPEIDEKNETFEATIDLRLTWIDPLLAFEAKNIGTTRLEYSGQSALDKLATIWEPKVIIANLVGAPQRVEPGLFINENGTVQYIQRIKAVFQTVFFLRSFPFDTEYLTFTLLSSVYNKDEVEFIQSEKEISHSKVDDSVKILGWNLKGVTSVSEMIRGWDGNFYPEFIVKVVISRNPLSHLIILTPLILIMLMPTFLTLYLDIEMARRLEAWAGAMLALVATSFTLNLTYPSLGTDSIINKLLSICFTYQLFMMFLTISLFNKYFTDKVENQYLVKGLIQFARWGVPIGFLINLAVQISLTALS